MHLDQETWKAITTHSDAYEEGIDAGVEGFSADTCPYEEGTEERIAWRAGFLGVC